jgi:hypothetical protein
MLALVAAVVLLDRTRPSTDEAAHARRRILPGFARAQATRIEIARRDGRTLSLAHESSGWWLTAPHRRADDNAVESLLAVLEFGQVERRASDHDAEARRRCGLEPPLVIVRAADHVLRIGGDGPARGVYLVRDDQQEVLVAEHRLVEAADRDPALWRSLQPTLSDPAQASRLGFGEWMLARDRGWQVTAPVKVRASDSTVETLVQTLARLRAARELDVAAPAAVGVALTLDGQQQARVDGDCPGGGKLTALVRADGALLCFAASDFDGLRAPVTTFYERRLIPVRLDDVRALDVTAAGRVLSLRRDEGVWRVIAPRTEGGPVSDDKVRAIVAALVEASARGFVGEAPRGPVVRVRVAGGDETVAVELGAAGGIGLGRREGETLSLEIDPALIATLAELTPAQLRTRDGSAN